MIAEPATSISYVPRDAIIRVTNGEAAPTDPAMPHARIIAAARLRFALLAACLCALLAAPAEAGSRSVIDAIIHVESKGHVHLTGRHGEIGLMQIKLATARSLGYRGTRAELYQPATNIRWGTAYFRAALKMARGNVDHALSLYQRGIFSRFRGCSQYCRLVKAAMR